MTHQVWCDHPFSQRNKATKRALGTEFGGEGRGWAEFEKGSRQYGGGGGSS